ncbi:MAG TPA: hypothetical protein VIM31_04515 [Candidatus Microsaccharimonas sp.]|jgi:hypothetical protein
MKNSKSKMTQATTTRNILATTLVIVIIGAAVGFYFGLQLIRGYALEVTHAVTDSHASGQNIDELSKLQQQLADGQGLVAKADALFSTPATYQTQALKDISKYASEAGVSISSIDSAKSDTATGAATTAPDYSETITIQSPVSYAKFLKFLDAIEGNLPKMQITGITIGRPTIQAGDQITTDKITVTVSTR